MSIAGDGKLNGGMSGQYLRGLGCCASPHNARNISVPQGVKVRDKTHGIPVSQEVALLGFLSLASILERLQPFCASFFHVPADHRGRMAIMPSTRPNWRIMGLSLKKVPKNIGHALR